MSEPAVLVNPLDARYSSTVVDTTNPFKSRINLTIRSATASDAGLLADLGARTFFETFAPDNNPEDMSSYIASAFSPERQASELSDIHTTFLIAEAAGDALGYAMLREGKAEEGITLDNPIELVRLYVLQEKLGSGIGKALMQACLNEAQLRNYRTLWLGVWEHNARAQAFYRKWNFRVVGTHIFQLGDDPQTDLLMERAVS